MAVIETKFSVGDTVWHASTATEKKQHPCPDCLDSREWKAISPAGDEFNFRCPRCSANYVARDELSLAYTASVPAVRKLTIGSVRYDSHDTWGEGKSPASYMCEETGVGGGSVYNEDRLFATEAEAQVAARSAS